MRFRTVRGCLFHALPVIPCASLWQDEGDVVPDFRQALAAIGQPNLGTPTHGKVLARKGNAVSEPSNFESFEVFLSSRNPCEFVSLQGFSGGPLHPEIVDHSPFQAGVDHLGYLDASTHCTQGPSS